MDLNLTTINYKIYNYKLCLCQTLWCTTTTSGGNGGIICDAAVSKPVHLAEACTPASDRATEARGGGGEGQLTEPGKTVLFTGPDTQSRNAFKQSKERKRKKGGRGEGGRKEERRNESRGNMCLTVRNCSGSNLHIYGQSPE